jgi:hypothetical protein
MSFAMCRVSDGGEGMSAWLSQNKTAEDNRVGRSGQREGDAPAKMRAPESVYATAFPFHAVVLKSTFEAAKLALQR